MPARLISIRVTVLPEASHDPAFKPHDGVVEWMFASEELPVLGHDKIDDMLQGAWSQACHLKIERDNKGLVRRIVKRVRGLV